MVILEFYSFIINSHYDGFVNLSDYLKTLFKKVFRLICLYC